MTILPLHRAGLAALALPALFLVAGCMSPEARLRAGLIDAGLSPPMAGCMAKSMTQRLSNNQLMKLRSLHKASKVNLRDMSYQQIAQQVRALGDPEIVAVTSTAAVGCALTM